MSTSPEPLPAERPDDLLVTLLSQWLARHIGDDELRRRLDEIGTAGLAPEQADAVDELMDEFDDLKERRGALERLVRETLEALALGG